MAWTPRVPRVEFDDAQYHVMCRGNRREEIFRGEDDERSFLLTLGQACERAGWCVHAFVLMRNHYHLVLETPAGNLVAGMRWFQTTYTARFNARHRLSGHLFQGRYKALVVDPGEPEYARQVADYIHLNPVRAGLAADEPELAALPWCSYRHYASPKGRPGWLKTEAVCGELGLRYERAADRRRLRKSMTGLIEAAQDRGDRGGEKWASASAGTGWVLGGEAFRERMEKMVQTVVKAGKRESYSGE